MRCALIAAARALTGSAVLKTGLVRLRRNELIASVERADGTNTSRLWLSQYKPTFAACHNLAGSCTKNPRDY